MRLLIAALFLAGCATARPPQTVDIAVPVSCAVEVRNPAFEDTDDALRAAADVFERVQRMTAGRPKHFIYEAQLLAALNGCK